MAAPIGAAISQSPRTLTVRADNDAFDFWMLPWNRPDEEYTSGVHITLDGGDAPRWARKRLSGLAPCIVGVRACRTASMEIGQDIYTPSVDRSTLRAPAGSRPNGGWLYLSQTARSLAENHASDVTFALGTTGPPSLAHFTQRLAHQAAPAYNRPTDWTNEIGFEPGVIAKLERRQRLVLSDEGFGADVIPRASVNLGNVLTNAEAGFQLRIGRNLPHPWLPVAEHTSLSLVLGGFAQAVARNIFLDGNSFRDGPRVGHEPFIGGGEIGIELRYKRFTAGYRAVSESRAWSGGPSWHPWSSLIGGFIVDR
jgi:hypothetical protein